VTGLESGDPHLRQGHRYCRTGGKRWRRLRC
jgi:hypothetical protein